MTTEEPTNENMVTGANENGGEEKANGAANKKRKNRKKKSKKGKNGAENGAAADPAEDDQAKLNPFACFRANLMKEGFTAEQIDKAIDEMWEKQLPYDEHDAVLKYLKSGGKDDSDSKTKKGGNKSAGAAAPVANNNNKPKEQKKSDTSSKDGSLNEDSKTSASSRGVEESKEDSTSEPEDIKQDEPMTMASKLDLVAGFENFTDAAYALTEWVLKAAKQHEIDELCIAKKTSALPTIIRRSFTEAVDQTQFDSSILPSVLRLATAIFNKCGIAPDAIEDTRDCFQSVIKSARKAVLYQNEQTMTSVEGDFADSIARFIVSRTLLAVDEAKISTADSCHSMKELEDEIDSLTSSLASGGESGMAELLSKRDLHRMAAKKASVVAKLAIQSLSNSSQMTAQNGGPSHGGGRESDMERSEIYRALVGEQGKENIDRNRREVKDLQQKLQEGESGPIQELRRSVKEFQSERLIIAQRIAELRQSIEKLEVYDAELCSKIVDMEAKIEDDTASRGKEAAEINSKIEVGNKGLKFGNAVGNLVDLLKKYDDSLDKAVNGSALSTSTDQGPGEIASSKMDMFLFRARNYFVTEAECVDCLRTRVQANQKEAAELKIEIAELECLGLMTTVGQLEEALKQKEETAIRESAILKRYIEEAVAQVEILVSRLEQYHASSEGASGLSMSQSNALQVIATNCTTRLGLPNGDKLRAFVNITTNGTVPLRQDLTSMSNTFQADTSQPTSIVAPIAPPTLPVVTEQAKIIPKFTWAAAGAKTTGDVASKKTSLLDIQREELQSKADN